MNAAEVPESTDPQAAATDEDHDVSRAPWFEEIADPLRTLVRAHPTATLAGAFLIGVALARGVRAWRESKA